MIPYIEKNETYAKIMPAVTSLHDPSFWSTCRLMGEEVVVLVVLPKKQRGILFKEDGRRKKIWAILALLFLLILYFRNTSADQPEFDPKKDKHQSHGLDVFFFQAVCADQHLHSLLKTLSFSSADPTNKVKESRNPKHFMSEVEIVVILE